MSNEVFSYSWYICIVIVMKIIVFPDFCVFDLSRSIFTFILKVKGFWGEQGRERIYAQKYKIET